MVVIYSSEDYRMDYVSWRSIESRTGISKSDVYKFILKELLDNAVDFIESGSHSNNNITPEIKAIIKLNNGTIANSKTISIIVRNSNPNNNPIARGNSKEMLKSIFKIGVYYSSKRNIFKITKGALGDALKEILCIPHALAEDRQIKWTLPLIIRNANKEFKIHLLVNKFNDTIHTDVDEAHYDLSGATEVEVTLPIIEKLTSTISLANYMRTYAMFVTHIRFTLIDEDKELSSFISLDATQQINTKWKNLSSAHWYKRPEFHRLLLGLSKENPSSETWSVLYNIIRETSNLKKDKAPESKLTLSEIVRSNESMNSLHDKLKQWMDASSTLSLPFDTAKRVRMKALKERVEKGIIGHSVDNSKVKYKQVFGVYRDDSDKGSELQIPFFYEIMIFHDIKNTIDTLMVKQALNCSAVPTVATIFRGEDKFYWFPTGSKFKWQAYSIDSILEHYGYSINKKDCKKPHSLILINLISPKLDYRSYGKSRIDFSPFASAIAETTIKACMGGGRGSDGKPAKNSVLLDILRDRKDKWESMDTMERIKNWWTMSDVFYATRKKLIEYGYTNDEINRNYITSLIKSTCEEDLYVKREEIGIIAADRAQLYFKKQWMDVGLDEIKELVEYGTDMLIIEKEGVVEQLKSFADEYGIALLNTRGFLTEYADILQDKAEKEGCNIAILTDFDASGLVMACKVPNAYRIGIDFDTLDYFELEIENVEEKYEAPTKHLDALKEGGEYYGEYSKEMIDYVEDKRIEINSVIAELDDNARFWGWIIEKLREHFRTRDYTRSVNIPEYVIPESLQLFNDKVKEKGIAIAKERLDKLQENLSNISGFLFDRTNGVLQNGKQITIEKYDQILADHVRHIIESNEEIRKLLDKIDYLNYEEESGATEVKEV